jgi:hypothetical protein
MREQLIRYLLGELDTEERRELRAQLRDNPELQRELAQLRECFAANEDDDAEPLPPGRLAERTAGLIADSDEYELEAMAAAPTRMASSGDPPSGVLGWSLADLTVAGGVMLAVSMLVFPALRDSRDGSRTTACQNNQYQLWVLISKHALDHGGYYPQVRPNENVGVYVAQLVKKGYVEPDELAVMLVCPASPVAGEIRAGRLALHIPSREEIRAMSPADLKLVFAGASPSYGYRLPHLIGGEYVDVRNIATTDLRFDPIFGDISGDPLNPMSPHHRGAVIQFIGRDGTLTSFTPASQPLFGGDADPFHNNLGVVLAGIGADDIVLGSSDAMPGLESQDNK